MKNLLNELLAMLAQYQGLAVWVSALLTSSAVICVAAAAALALRRRSARARSVIWRLAMIALLVVGAWRLAPDVSPPAAVIEWQVDLSAPGMLKSAPDEIELTDFVLPKKTWRKVIAEHGNRWCLHVWLRVAVAWLFIRLGGVWFGLKALRRRSGDAGAVVQCVGDEAGLPDGTQYRIVSKLESPMLTGWRTPVIWLPSGFETWGKARLYAVLRHEAAHWRRSDWLWQWLAQVTLCLWWWQPLAWLARSQLRIETEHAADDMVVADTEHAPEYARTLVEIAAGLPVGMSRHLGVTMFGNDGVKQRVQALIRTNRWRGRIGFIGLTMLGVVVVALTVLASTTVEFVPRAPVYQSNAKLVAGGRMPGDFTKWHEQQQDFYGTIIETLESVEMKRRALERVRALNPKLTDQSVEIDVTQHKRSALFDVRSRCKDEKYARIFLDALLDEFISFRQGIREQAQGKNLQVFLQEVVKAQKVMEERTQALEAFQRKNNIVVLTNAQNAAATFLEAITSQREKLRIEAAEMKLSLDSITDATAARGGQSGGSSGNLPTEPEASYLKTKNELFVLDNERRFLLQTHAPDHPEVRALDEKIAKAQFLLKSLAAHITEELQQRYIAIPRRMAVLDEQHAAKEQEVLELAGKLAEHERLKAAAQTTKEAYQKLFGRVETLQLGNQMDYVVIQERATPATVLVQNDLIPIWKLWSRETEPPAKKKES
ncbi:MAG: M56 family metallopeptidase [Prosthecobacter sp.]